MPNFHFHQTCSNQPSDFITPKHINSRKCFQNEIQFLTPAWSHAWYRAQIGARNPSNQDNEQSIKHRAITHSQLFGVWRWFWRLDLLVGAKCFSSARWTIMEVWLWTWIFEVFAWKAAPIFFPWIAHFWDFWVMEHNSSVFWGKFILKKHKSVVRHHNWIQKPKTSFRQIFSKHWA